ncbi:CLUMA_CG020119, isoform A [Clunio marinus]|uniref:CLUMA_CG020119, isoform A n=1 Tax=Clunio marinus TaxID=568069 RepID=A0A1J1J3X0_9DIPT|nr:CLUMA_CG020119, isoform A [Clunio marinus]
MLIFLIPTSIVLISSNLIAVAICGPLDWAKVEVPWAQADRIPIDVNLPWLPFENETRCYGEIGCLNITREWYHLIHRPFNVFPLPRNVINTKFILYTENNPNVGQILNPEDKDSILDSNFKSKQQVKFIIHGFIDTPLSNWVSDMKNELLEYSKQNEVGMLVIVVDWAGGSLPLYTQATANTRLVGLELAYLIQKLIDEHGLQPEDVHLIGHSLGAHLSAYAGERVKNIGRITALDPAEPYFQGMPTNVRLDPSDALFIDVIHTDARSFFLLEIPGYGMSQQCGHLDFYPNNGKEQPGCALSQESSALIPLTLIKDGIEEASRVLLACNHVRAVKLFIDSINGNCSYVAHRCPSYQHFTAGKCFKCNSGNCALMGYHATLPYANTQNENSKQTENDILSDSYPIVPQPGKYFLMTGKDPYCQRHYRFIIELAKPRVAEQWVQGFLSAGLFSERGKNLRNLDLTPKGTQRFEHGKSYIIVVTNANELADRVNKVELNWSHEMNVLEPRTLCLFWCNDHLYVKSVSVDIMQMPSREKRDIERSNKLCPKQEYADIRSLGRSVFYDNSCKR